MLGARLAGLARYSDTDRTAVPARVPDNRRFRELKKLPRLRCRPRGRVAEPGAGKLN